MATMECPVERNLAGKLPLARQKGKGWSQLREKNRFNAREVSVVLRSPASWIPGPGACK